MNFAKLSIHTNTNILDRFFNVHYTFDLTKATDSQRFEDNFTSSFGTSKR